MEIIKNILDEGLIILNAEWREVSKLNIKFKASKICEWKKKKNNMIIIGGWNKKR